MPFGSGIEPQTANRLPVNFKANGRFARFAKSFLKDDSAAVAALYAVSLFVLVAIAGVAWDWTQMTAMDSELQNAADQAALAAATQLDGNDGATDRAEDAAAALVANITKMSNDGSVDAIAIDSVTFYEEYDQASDEYGAETTVDADASVVKVRVEPREVNFGITPLVGVLRSGEIFAEASAALGSAICNTPPVMMCNPFEDSGDEDLVNFSADDYVGVGLRLISDDAGAPGNFGFLRNGLGTGAQDLASSLGYDSQPGECVPGTGVTTEPGLKDVVFNAFNTRFDMDINGANTCPGGAANCSAAANVRKDLVHRNQCGTTGQGWQQSAKPYRPTSNTLLTPAQYQGGNIDVMGLPRDTCHAWSEAGNCSSGDGYGIVGTGTWDRDAYFWVNYGWAAGTWETNTGLDSDATRYEVYEWEIANPTANTHSASTSHAHSQPYCRAAGDANRRKITAAVINCSAEGVAGHEENVAVGQWMELFLVEPSFTRRRTSSPSSEKMTDANDVYVEIIRAVPVGGDAGENSVVRRDIPYLIR